MIRLRREIGIFISKAARYEATCMVLNRYNYNLNSLCVDVMRREEGIPADSLNLEYMAVFENTRALYERYGKLIRSMKFMHARIRRNFGHVRNIYLNFVLPLLGLTDHHLNVLKDFKTSVWLLAHVLQAIFITIDKLTHNLTDANEILQTFIYSEIRV
ncbi:hypothetical protein TNCT_217841 [Trichonephila clavata]|uniref:Uncharacterized protein n=1 Tax=Trichonephila clavata TaxID=2740835 RepID=A0A8X6JCP2_TRICU|nr:hypothetical protein TNCT_217841 [Trichonephila clavata]